MKAQQKHRGGLIVALSALVVSLGFVAFVRGDPDDPFSRANRYQPKLSLSSKKLASLIDFKITVEPPKARPGEIVRLTIAGVLKSGYHTYPLTQRASGQTAISKISFEENRDLAPLWPCQESAPKFVINQINEIDLEHDDPFTWSQEILVLPSAGPGIKEFDVFIHLQVCDNKGCYGPDLYPPMEARLEVLPGPFVSLTPELTKRLDLKKPEIQVVSAPADLVARAKTAKAEDEAKMADVISKKKDGLSTTKGETNQPGDNSQVDQNNLWGLLGAAFGGAFFMLLTPCVFPMIPITVNFFLKQSEKEHHNPLRMASVYSGTIILLLTVVMLALGKVVIALANNPWFNLALGGVLILFALSLFGMFELELPPSLARFTSAREGQGGLLGTIFMAMTFTITSFTCTGPFLGVMLAPIAGIKPPFLYLILAALVYSITFAAPFFVMALFPSILKKLPKSGGWLNIIKVVMGFLELGAALKFLANTDFYFNPGNPRVFNFDTVLCAWIALSFACGLYLIGVYRLPHDDPPEHIGVLRMLFATIFFGLTVYLTPALFGMKLNGIVGENVIAFLPPKLEETGGFANAFSSQPRTSRLAWHLHYQDAWQEAVKNDKLILIDFTGVNCTNCRDNEQNVFPLPDVLAAMSNYVRVQLYTDTVPDKKLTSAEAKDQADRNARWRDKIADPTNPTYVVFRPEKDQPYDAEDFLRGRSLRIERGKIFDVPAFITFLRAPLQEKAGTMPPVASK